VNISVRHSFVVRTPGDGPVQAEKIDSYRARFGLLVRVPWIDKILDGSKTWEIRGSQTTKRGRIGLIESGTGTVVDAVELVAVVGPLSLAELSPNWRKAGFDDERVSILPYRQTFAWVLRNPKRLKQPVPYNHPSGAVIWVNLKHCVEQAVLRQIGVTQRV
jgi:ASCH domain